MAVLYLEIKLFNLNFKFKILILEELHANDEIDIFCWEEFNSNAHNVVGLL